MVGLDPSLLLEGAAALQQLVGQDADRPDVNLREA